MTTPKNTGSRKCIVCGSTAGKTDLIRLVRSSDGSVSYDPTGRAAGRGAYVCSMACFEKARANHRFDGALRVSIDADAYAKIAEQITADASAVQG